MQSDIPRIMITSTSSGGGKTTITCGLIKTLMNRNLQVSTFKCGPDYIDPLFHYKITGDKCTNLDLFFMNENLLKQTFDKNAKGSDIAVIEGVMGYYDGLGGTTPTASSYEVSSCLNCPTILIVDAKGTSYSVIATILGFIDLYENSNIIGVIFNRCTKSLYSILKPVVTRKCGVVVLGFLPYDEDVVIGSRHLGLITANEIFDLYEKIEKISVLMEQNINIDLLVKLAKENKAINYTPQNIERGVFSDIPKNPTIGVALDNAFCFYYNETLDLFKDLGYTIKYFSPICDEQLPKGCDALYFGGGYPELYLEELSNNITMIEDVKKAIINKKIPTIAECGGFMYLGESIDDSKMVGIIQADFYNANKLTRFGYINLHSNKDNLIVSKGEIIKAHEFHYYDCQNNGDTFTAKKPIGKRTWEATHSNDNLIAGFPHLYLPSLCYSNS